MMGIVTALKPGRVMWRSRSSSSLSMKGLESLICLRRLGGRVHKVALGAHEGLGADDDLLADARRWAGS